jgi:hypothetical protein
VMAFGILDVLADLMRGSSHSRTTVASMGVSLPTADRWLVELRRVPGVSKRRLGKVTAYLWKPTRPMLERARWEMTCPHCGRITCQGKGKCKR